MNLWWQGYDFTLQWNYNQNGLCASWHFHKFRIKFCFSSIFFLNFWCAHFWCTRTVTCAVLFKFSDVHKHQHATQTDLSDIKAYFQICNIAYTPLNQTEFTHKHQKVPHKIWTFEVLSTLTKQNLEQFPYQHIPLNRFSPEMLNRPSAELQCSPWFRLSSVSVMRRFLGVFQSWLTQRCL